MSVSSAAEADALGEALRLMKEALKIIDNSEAPGDIAAHVDLAVTRLADYLGNP